MSQSQFPAAHKESKACKFEDPLVELDRRDKVKVNFQTYTGYEEARRCCRIWKYVYGDETETKLCHFSFGKSEELITTRYTIWSFTMTVEVYEKFRNKWGEE